MQKEISPRVVAVVIAVIVVVLGLWAWRTVFAPPSSRAGKNPYEGRQPTQPGVGMPGYRGPGGPPGGMFSGGAPPGGGAMPSSGR
jgi:hypothetical protein